MAQNISQKNKLRTAWRIWLGGTILLVVLMMIVGAATRLTESGLSMVEWRPLFGWLPPLSVEEWERVFGLYQQTSQYKLANQGMELAAFKEIFWWEYFHRLLGRVIGLFYGLPFLWWALQNKLPSGHKTPLFLLLLLGGFQGFIGWWMVTSGFVDRTEVSQVRLAIHLGIAFIIFGGLLWIYLNLHIGLNAYGKIWQRVKPKKLTLLFAYLPLLIIFITIIAGALTAGLRAGYIYNEWPFIEGKFIPEVYWDSNLGWHSFYNDHATVQINHRLMAYFTLITCIGAWLYFTFSKIVNHGMNILVLAVLAQIALGIVTLLLVVPISLGVLHQFMAAIVFGLAIRHAFLATKGI